MNTTRLTTLCLVTLAALLIGHAAFATTPAKILTGTVIDTTGEGIPGATVLLLTDSAVITGASTDADGCFRLKLNRADSSSLILRISSLGFCELTRPVHTEDTVLVRLIPRAIDIAGITVRPEPDHPMLQTRLSAETVTRAARQALVPTNVAAAIKSPDIARVGSSHSSQLRVHGTSPMYYLNGIPIGYDPDHYGMFTIIPATVLDNVRFYPMGTGPEYGLSSSVEMNSATPFGGRHHADINLSTIEATGTFSYGADRAFLLGSLRKSVLDKLVKQFDVNSDRQTLPPTNFQDIFVSSGLRLSRRYRLMVDHYYVSDYFSYNTAEAAGVHENVSTFQHSNERLYSLRLEDLTDSHLLRFTLAARSGKKTYRAVPGTVTPSGSVSFDLTEHRCAYLTGLQTRFELGRTTISAGSRIEYVARRQIDMVQQNWNFLPPFAHSNNPYIYQQALNETYGTYSGENTETNSDVFAGLSREMGAVTIDAGLRAEHFSSLADRDALTHRLHAAVRLGYKNTLEIFHGTFAENPVNNVLEPYQVLIHAGLGKLNPIRERVLSAGFSRGTFHITVFDKKRSQLPVISPDFSRVYDKSGNINEDFIAVSSTGTARFYGLSAGFEIEHFIIRSLTLSSAYAHTHAYQIDNGVQVPYELNAPHRFSLQTYYSVSARLDIGAELQVRSGYPYTPSTVITSGGGESIYTPDYYQAFLSYENSEQFPASAGLNIHGSYTINNVRLFASISNVTNRGNPIISSGDRYIYDAGILPTIGLEWRF